MTEEAKGGELAQAIRALVTQELKRRGQTATPRFEGNDLVVGQGPAEVRTGVAGTLAQWAELPDDLRGKRIAQIAELLTPTPRAPPGAPRPPARGRAGWPSMFAPLLVVLVTGGVLAVAYRYLAPHGDALLNFMRSAHVAPSASAALAPDPDRERTLLARAACEQSLARVARGSNIGPTDVEGWVVELVLLRRAGGTTLESSPALAQYIAKKPGAVSSSAGVVAWAGARSLSTVKRFDAEVNVQPIPDLGSQHLAGISLEFTGPYVTPYFSEAQRADYFLLADALSDALKVTDGALFAHCAGASGHHIGSWFMGATPGAAVASLVYFMAFFSETPLLKSDLLSRGNSLPGGAFDTISAKGADLDRSAAATLIGTELGMISGRPTEPVRLTFPFRDANRATRASLMAARALRLADR